MVDSVGMPQAYRTPARQLHGSMTIGLTCQLEESVAKRLASELAYALCVARPVLGDAVITLLRLERLDHDTVDASKRARGLGSVLCRPDTTLGRGGARSRWRSSPEHQVMALLVQLVGRQISPRVQAALGCFPVHLERSEHARVVSKRLPLCHSLLSRECRIALLPIRDVLKVSNILDARHNTTHFYELLRLFSRSPCLCLNVKGKQSHVAFDTFA